MKTNQNSSTDPTGPVRIGVVGCGVVATAYYLPCLLEAPEAELVAVCDANPVRSEHARRLFRAREVYADFNEMLVKADIDCVFILTGPGSHVRFTLAALEAGKHVLLQKPMALDLAGAEAIVSATRRTGLKVLVEPSSHSPLDPYYVKLREIVKRGALGRPYWFDLTGSRPDQPSPMLGGNPYGIGAFFSKDSGGVLFDYPYMPGEIVSVLGPCATVSGSAKISQPDRAVVPDSEYDRWLATVQAPEDANYWPTVLELPKTQAIKMEAPDNIFSLYEMREGWSGIFHAGRTFQPTYPGNSIGGLQIFGTEGNIIFGAGGHFAAVYSALPDRLPEADDDGWFRLPARATGPSRFRGPVPRPGDFNYYHESTRHLLACIREDRDPVPSVEWARHITEMLHGAMVSSQTGRRYEMTSSVDW